MAKLEEVPEDVSETSTSSETTFAHPLPLALKELIRV
jgi:hypothetical protein